MPTRSVRQALSAVSTGQMADLLHVLPAGEAMNLLPRIETLACSGGVAVPAVPAGQILWAYSRSTGLYVAPQKPEGAVADATQIAVGPNGNIVVDATETSIDVCYFPIEGTVVTEVIQLASSTGSFLSGKTSRKILSASVVTGVTPGAALAPVARGTSSPASGKVALLADGSGVKVNSANVVAGSITVTYVATPNVSVGAALNSPSPV